MEKIKAYAEADAEDPIKLFDMMAPLYFNMCPIIPKPFSEMLLSASGSKINSLLVRAYLQDRHSIPKATETEAFQGALSFAVPGLYSNCFKIDIASLYPNIIVTYSVYDNEKDPKGYLLELVKTFKESRLQLKKLANETGDPLYKQMDTTTKGILNSFYGFFSASGLNFNSPECGSFITAKGREILEYTIKWASGKDASEFIKNGEAEDDECA
jgi:DNA polymerase elongation subunit (family B)